MTKKKITFLAVAAVVVIGVSGGAVYAHNYQEEQLKIQQEKEEQEKKEEAEKAKQIRVEEARAGIDKELDEIEKDVVSLYADVEKKLLADGLTQDMIEAVQKELRAFKETYKADPDISKEQAARSESLDKEFQYVPDMFEITESYNSLYPDGKLTAPGDTADELVKKIKTALEALKSAKPDFNAVYIKKINDTESALAGQVSVRDAVFMIYDKETGTMVEGVTREQYQDVLEAVNSLPENALKTELLGYLPTVDQTLNTQEEAARKAAQGNQSANSKQDTKSSGTGNTYTSGDDNSYSGGSSGGNSSGGGEEQNSGGSSSSNEQTGNADATGGNEEDYGRWEGTITGGGDITGGGTWEGGTW